MNVVLPSRCSTRGPNRYSANMLNAMCEMPERLWVNMYVMIVHGRWKRNAGTSANSSVTTGNVIWSRKTMMFATSSRPTQGVIPEF